MLRLQPVALSFPNAAVIEKAKCHTSSLKTGPQMNLNLVADVKLYVKLRRRRGSAAAHHQTFFVFLKYVYDCNFLDVISFLFVSSSAPFSNRRGVNKRRQLFIL